MPGTLKCSINVGSLPLLLLPAKAENEVGWHPDGEKEVTALTQEPPGLEQGAWTASGSALGTAKHELTGISLSLSLQAPHFIQESSESPGTKKCSTSRALVQIPSFFLYFCASLAFQAPCPRSPTSSPFSNNL